jgi:hypothetical protein
MEYAGGVRQQWIVKFVMLVGGDTITGFVTRHRPVGDAAVN